MNQQFHFNCKGMTMGNHQLFFEGDDLMIETDSDGSIESAMVYCEVLQTHLDCTEYVKNSTYWLEKTQESYAADKINKFDSTDRDIQAMKEADLYE